MVLLWDGWSPLARHDEQAFRVALSVLGGRANADRGCTFAVLLRGEGPTIDLPELPSSTETGAESSEPVRWVAAAARSRSTVARRVGDRGRVQRGERPSR